MSDFSNFPSLFSEDDLRQLQKENIDIEDIMKEQLRTIDRIGENKRQLTQREKMERLASNRSTHTKRPAKQIIDLENARRQNMQLRKVLSQIQNQKHPLEIEVEELEHRLQVWRTAIEVQDKQLEQFNKEKQNYDQTPSKFSTIRSTRQIFGSLQKNQLYQEQSRCVQEFEEQFQMLSQSRNQRKDLGKVSQQAGHGLEEIVQTRVEATKELEEERRALAVEISAIGKLIAEKQYLAEKLLVLEYIHEQKHYYDDITPSVKRIGFNPAQPSSDAKQLEEDANQLALIASFVQQRLRQLIERKSPIEALLEQLNNSSDFFTALKEAETMIHALCQAPM